MGNAKVKLAIRFETSTPGEFEVESLWATATADGYELDNIPFYVSSLAYGDVVAAHVADDGMLEVDGLIRPSGHSTVRLWISDVSEVQRIRDQFRAMGCASELSDLPRLVALDVPPEVPYQTVKVALEQGQAAAQFDYEEACLGQTAPTSEGSTTR